MGGFTEPRPAPAPLELDAGAAVLGVELVTAPTPTPAAVPRTARATALIPELITPPVLATAGSAPATPGKALSALLTLRPNSVLLRQSSCDPSAAGGVGPPPLPPVGIWLIAAARCASFMPCAGGAVGTGSGCGALVDPLSPCSWLPGNVLAGLGSRSTIPRSPPLGAEDCPTCVTPGFEAAAAASPKLFGRRCWSSTSPPSAKRAGCAGLPLGWWVMSTRSRRLLMPTLRTVSAGSTNSPLDKRAGMESDVPEPGPRTGPPLMKAIRRRRASDCLAGMETLLVVGYQLHWTTGGRRSRCLRCTLASGRSPKAWTKSARDAAALLGSNTSASCLR